MIPRCLLLPAFFLALQSPLTLRADEASFVADLEAAGLAAKKENGVVVEVGVAIRVAKEQAKSGWTPELLKRLPELPEVAKVHVLGSFVDNTALEVFTKLPKLEALRLGDIKFDDEGFATIARCPGLKVLYISGNDAITGKGVAALKPLTGLQALGFADCPKFNREGVQACAQLTQLAYLGLSKLDLGDEEMALLAPLAGTLKDLDVNAGFNGKMSEAGLEHISRLKSLETLSFEETIIPFQNTLKHLLALPNLKLVRLDNVDTSKEEAIKLKSALPNCQFKGAAATEKQVKLYNENREKYLKSR